MSCKDISVVHNTCLTLCQYIMHKNIFWFLEKYAIRHQYPLSFTFYTFTIISLKPSKTKPIFWTLVFCEVRSKKRPPGTSALPYTFFVKWGRKNGHLALAPYLFLSSVSSIIQSSWLVSNRPLTRSGLSYTSVWARVRQSFTTLTEKNKILKKWLFLFFINFYKNFLCYR